uniref:hypothetical protein n=1 Tax=Streptomyces longwoodensis TaxID=68231 RepID=UPI002F90C506
MTPTQPHVGRRPHIGAVRRALGNDDLHGTVQVTGLVGLLQGGEYVTAEGPYDRLVEGE